MKLGITGHRKLTNPQCWVWVEGELTQLVTEFSKQTDQLTAISSLAIGADQLFANLVLRHGGNLHAVIPCSDYRIDFRGEDQVEYDRILKQARKVEILPDGPTRDESYLGAGKRVVDLSDVLIAVWDGKKAAGLGGTGDVVDYAKQISKRIMHLNPYEQSIQTI